MKYIEKLIIVLIIVAPIIWAYVALQPYMEKDDLVEDIVSEGIKNEDPLQTDKTIINNDKDVVKEYEGEMEGEKYKSTIGNPIGKIIAGGEINISVANIYLDADENSEVVDTLTKHTIVTAQTYPGGWSRIKNDKVSGWMKSEHITLPEEVDNVVIGSVIGRKGTVNVDSLNVRQSASKTAKKVTSLIGGTEVTILAISKDGEWYQVQINSKSDGWVAKDYLTVK